ncbi:peptidoglycan-binding domain-containing protein [Streptomyces cyanogenus]|uniref:Zinc D-Ala-D-Ala carboxypeptidase n=1 Tax=Streptomyces cyanogenus TaxID=80860 RepID=A0ABX7TJT8_STRCY|nr:peptidoglycan-binding domain-containing protein [Streptomyces cyanogenus]QTD96083.1 Zinc D-Ala-D-Ala carboxypeptidase precursor [Streptomyces cyanogenus]
MPLPPTRVRVLGALALTAGLLATVPATAAHAAAGPRAVRPPAQAAAVHPCTYRSTVGYTCDYYYGTATIGEGSSNADAVREIQDIVNQHTDYPVRLSVDGSFGPATLAAVKWLQSHHHITGGADGIVGSHTWDYLRR